MSPCKRWQESFGEAIYGDLSETRQRELAEHLSRCARCSDEYHQLEATVQWLRQEAPLRPDPAALDQVWSRLAPRLDQDDRAAAWHWRRSKQRAVWGLAAAAVLAAAIGLALLLSEGGSQEPAHLADTTLDTATDTATDDPRSELRYEFDQYLHRATPLILSIANRDLESQELEGFDLEAERRLARQLAVEAKCLSDRLHHGSRLDREQGLVAELEVVFLQIANLYGRHYSDGIDLVRTGLDRRAILFQLSVEEMRRQTVGQDPSV